MRLMVLLRLGNKRKEGATVGLFDWMNRHDERQRMASDPCVRRGHHDWEVVDSKEPWQIHNAPNRPPRMGDVTLEKRVCLECGLIDDQIQAYRDGMEQAKQLRDDRQKRAAEILERARH